MDFLDNIALPPEKLAEINRWSFGKDWTRRAIRAEQARIYIGQHLTRTLNTATPVGWCCNAGTEVWERQDGSPITDDDVTALLAIDRGQVNQVKSRTDKSVTIYWLCDSSD